MCSREPQAKKNAAVKASFLVAEEIARAAKFVGGCIFEAVHAEGLRAGPCTTKLA